VNAARSSRPLGRRPGDPEQTKSAILDAARGIFGRAGFDRATIRAVAAEADVDPALVIHHFGSKRGLFVAAHELPFDPAEFVTRIAAVPPDERGRRFTEAYLSMLDRPSSPALSLLRAATTDEDAARMLREFVTDTLLDRASELAPGDDGELRLALAASQLVGVAFGRHVLGLEPLREIPVDRLVDAIAPTVQRHLEGDRHGGDR
jgi:AcrR family transcriptional regulator